jgi:hypothetical protein
MILCLNLAVTLVNSLGAVGAIPGYNYLHPISGANSTLALNQSQNLVSYGNVSSAAGGWINSTSNYGTGILGVFGMIGDIVNSLPTFFKIMLSVVFGFPALIASICTVYGLNPLNPVSSSDYVVTIFLVAFEGIFFYLMLLFVVELISGRETLPY